MKVDSVEIVPDQAALKGGQAIIRLKGIWLLPPGATFRIEPADGNTSFNRMRGWPRGDLRARATRVTGQGIELIIGPDIVDAPDLTPGTRVRLRIQTISLDTVLDWPALPVARPSHPRALAASTNRTEPSSREAETPTDGTTASPTPATDAPPANAVDADDTQFSGDTSPGPSALGLTDNESDVLQRATVSPSSAPPLPPPSSTPPSKEPPSLASLNLHKSPNKTPPPPLPDPLPDPLLQQAVSSSVPVAHADNGTGNLTEHSPLKAPSNPSTEAHRPETVTATPPLPDFPPQPQNTAATRWDLPPAIPPEPTDLPLIATETYEPPSAPQPHRDTPPSTGSKSQSVGVALFSLLIASLAAIGFRNAPQVNGSDAQPARQQATIAALQPGAAPQAPKVSVAAASKQSGPLDLNELASSFSAGAISPRGTSAAASTTSDALVAANRSLYGIDGAATDREEAAFWLRTALARQMQGPGITWALTQLGTYYASPAAGQKPNYDKARLLWELAAAQSDPVANCFLAQLHEFGLGVTPDRKTALTHYQTAKSLGGTAEVGCKGLDQALARLAN